MYSEGTRKMIMKMLGVTEMPSYIEVMMDRVKTLSDKVDAGPELRPAEAALLIVFAQHGIAATSPAPKKPATVNEPPVELPEPKIEASAETSNGAPKKNKGGRPRKHPIAEPVIA